MDGKIDLEDASNYINKRFSKIEQIKDNKDKDNISEIKILLEEIDNKIDFIDIQKDFLKNELDKNAYEKAKKKFKSKCEKYKNEFENLFKNIEKNNDPENIDSSFDHDNANIEEEYKRGMKILDADDKIIGELIDIVSKDNETCMVVKKNLKEQEEKINYVDPDLKDIQFSLKRAGKKIRRMMIDLSKDKIIKCLIAIISIIIITIIIVSFFGGDKKNNYNLPIDIFGTNNKNNNKNNSITTYDYSLGLFNQSYYTLLLLIFLIL